MQDRHHETTNSQRIEVNNDAINLCLKWSTHSSVPPFQYSYFMVVPWVRFSSFTGFSMGGLWFIWTLTISDNAAPSGFRTASRWQGERLILLEIPLGRRPNIRTLPQTTFWGKKEIRRSVLLNVETKVLWQLFQQTTSTATGLRKYETSTVFDLKRNTILRTSMTDSTTHRLSELQFGNPKYQISASTLICTS